MKLLLLLATLVSCSPGDNLPEFQSCVEACGYSKCNTPTYYENPYLSQEFESSEPLFWDCASDCDYQCQQIVTRERVQNGEEVVQFHGKWPFKRVWNTQEFASALFSVGNLVPHYINFRKSYAVWKESFALRPLYFNIVLMSLITSCAWVFSTIFHIRDTLISERLDYFFAGATVLSGFHGLVIRVFRLDLDSSRRRVVSGGCVVMYCYHVLRLTYDWSYTYNMRANIFIAVLQYILMLRLGYYHYQRDPRGKLWTKPPIMILSVVLAMSFEVFDFISLKYQVDAHAMWHLFTIVPGFWLYDFLFEDLETLKGYVD